MTLVSKPLELGRVDSQRLQRGVPEPCYAAAHEEILAYRDTAAALFEDVLPMAAESETVMGMFPLIFGMDAELRARHPGAYVEDSTVGLADISPVRSRGARVLRDGESTFGR